MPKTRLIVEPGRSRSPGLLFFTPQNFALHYRIWGACQPYATALTGAAAL